MSSNVISDDLIGIINRLERRVDSISVSSRQGSGSGPYDFTGEVRLYGGEPDGWGGAQETIPGWLLCNGAAVSRDDYDDLFNVIGTRHGVGDGSTTFNLPNCRGKTMMCLSDSGTFNTIGAIGGVETVILDIGDMPAHAHPTSVSDTKGAHTHTGVTGAGGSHDHGGSSGTAGSHSHSVNAHSHALDYVTNTRIRAHTSDQEASGYGLTSTANFQDRVIVSASANLNVGVQGDTETASPSTDSQGSHSHSIPSQSTHTHTLGSDGGHIHDLSIVSQGGDSPHENMPPYIVIGVALIRY